MRMRHLAAVLAAVVAAGAARAQAPWSPSHPVEIVAGSAAGGAQDRTARTMQRLLRDGGIVDQPIAVVNKPGGGGAVSLTYLDQHADGHVVVLSSPTLLTRQISGAGPSYRDYTPLAVLFGEYIVIATRADSPLKSAADLAARMKRDPASVSAAVATARGGMQHVAVGLLAKAAGADVKRLKVVVFNSGGESMTSVLGGHVDVVATAAANAAAMVKAGKLRVLGVAAPDRLEGVYADVPTFTEQGYPVVASNWRSVLGPRELAPAQIAYWDGVLGRLVRTPAWRDDLRKENWTAHYLPSGAARKYMDEQYGALKDILADLLAGTK